VGHAVELVTEDPHFPWYRQHIIDALGNIEWLYISGRCTSKIVKGSSLINRCLFSRISLVNETSL